MRHKLILWALFETCLDLCRSYVFKGMLGSDVELEESTIWAWKS